jgi:hypothetical protein
MSESALFYYLIVDGVREGPFGLERAAQRAVLAEERGHRVEFEALAKTSILRQHRLAGLAARVQEIRVEKEQCARNRSQQQNP